MVDDKLAKSKTAATGPSIDELASVLEIIVLRLQNLHRDFKKDSAERKTAPYFQQPGISLSNGIPHEFAV